MTESTIERQETGPSESELIRWWLSLEQGSRISASDGEDVYLFEQGHRNVHDGPDFLNAQFLLDGKTLKGDIEFHVRERDWFSHHHDRDPRYNNVVLHIVVKPGSKRTVTRSGKSVTLVPVRPGNVFSRQEKFCQLTGECDEEKSTRKLRRLAKIRWMRKVSRIRNSIRETGDAREAFYVESFRSLGLKGNENAFERLSRSVPLSTFLNLAEPGEVLAVLLGTSGLLDFAPTDKDFGNGDYRRLWRSLSRTLLVKEVIASDDWRRKGIRPNAFPERRLGWGARLAWSLVSGWEPWRDKAEETLSRLDTVLDEKSGGKGWQGEWLGNVIIPFREAWDEFSKGRGNSKRYEIWFGLDLGYTYGRLSRQFSPHLRQRQLTSFGVQQGLLALSERYCEMDLCGACPLRE
ncbi:MAG: DUF2851 family protein [Candidatus Neomarinimicrobiota bacterium]